MSARATIIAMLVLLVGCGPTREVPKDSCQYMPTGRERAETTMMCASYDSKSNCTVWVPIVTTYREVVTTCKFKEWI